MLRQEWSWRRERRRAVQQCPVVSSVTATPAWVVSTGATALIVAATDSDGNTLAYSWASLARAASAPTRLDHLHAQHHRDGDGLHPDRER